jgi:hypothetical protein
MSMTGTTNATVDARLAQLRDLQSQFDRVRERLRRAEEQKGTVTRRTYDKVRAEYDRELDTLRAQMTPLRDELESQRQTIEDALKQANGSLESLEEELAEAVFRHRVGEFTDAELADKRRSIDARLETARARMAEQRRTLDMFGQVAQPSAPIEPVDPAELAAEGALAALDVDTRPEPAVQPEPLVTETPAAVRRPVLRTMPPTAPSAPAPPRRETVAPSNDFENPHDWIKEMGRDNSRPAATATRPSSVAAPPRPATSDASAPRRPMRTPSLVFVNGGHAGESFALLPTTMTIGREHDNNVELKDPDVARYHARIVHERGNYVIEDLDSATGTWVNGKRARRVPLNHGDVVRVGSTEIAIDFEWASDPSQ